jgi:hypothetical protein
MGKPRRGVRCQAGFCFLGDRDMVGNGHTLMQETHYG